MRSHYLTERTPRIAGFIQKPVRVEELDACLTTVSGSASGRPDDRQPDDTGH
jgi:hypothetical protein